MTVETKQVLADVKAGRLQPWWNLDTYIVAHLAELLAKLRDEGHGVPLRFAGDNHDGTEWNEYLTDLIERLEAYDVDNPKAYADTQAALHEFAAHLSDFWD